MKSALPMDYHSHHRRCGHADGELLDYALAALSAGLTHFGVSDHGPAYFLEGDHPLPYTQMPLSAYPAYIAEARALQSELAGTLSLAVGVEADFIEGREGDLEQLLRSQPLDYVLGSVHYCLGSSIFKRSRWADERPAEVFADYYRLVALAARSGLFDILSHVTAVEAYAPERECAQKFYEPVADAIAESGCIVEVNTSGYRKMGGDEPFPGREMLRLLIERHVPLTFGSDCHDPGEVAFGSERTASLLSELGVDLSAGPQPVTVRRGPLLAYKT